MDKLDRELLRAWTLSTEAEWDAAEAELNELLPALIEADYVDERPWGEDTGWTLWSFSELGIKRIKELEALEGQAGAQE